MKRSGAASAATFLAWHVGGLTVQASTPQNGGSDEVLREERNIPAVSLTTSQTFSSPQAAIEAAGNLAAAHLNKSQVRNQKKGSTKGKKWVYNLSSDFSINALPAGTDSNGNPLYKGNAVCAGGGWRTIIYWQ